VVAEEPADVGFRASVHRRLELFDLAAVVAGLTLDYNSGAVEGSVTSATCQGLRNAAGRPGTSSSTPEKLSAAAGPRTSGQPRLASADLGQRIGRRDRSSPDVRSELPRSSTAAVST